MTPPIAAQSVCPRTNSSHFWQRPDRDGQQRCYWCDAVKPKEGAK